MDVVLNYDVPINAKDYVHRVGRTARAGRAGRAVTLVTQYDVELFQRVEALTGVTLPAFPADTEAALLLAERVGEAQRLATAQMKEADSKRKGGGGGGKRKGGGEGMTRAARMRGRAWLGASGRSGIEERAWLG